MEKKRTLLLVPLDPVHDLGLRMIHRQLVERGHSSTILPPDLSLDDVLRKATEKHYDYILISRTMGYEIAELLAKLVDRLDAAGVRKRTKLVIGGKAINPELAAELGFDRGFSSRCSVEEVIAYIEGREYQTREKGIREKRDITARYSYSFRNAEFERLLREIVDEILAWADGKTSPGIQRKEIRRAMLEEPGRREQLLKEYLSLCDRSIVRHYRGERLASGTRRIEPRETEILDRIEVVPRAKTIQHIPSQPLAIIFTGSGCPIMDVMHNKIADEWGVDGIIYICPSWVARREGLLEGLVSHAQDGTIPTLENIELVQRHLGSHLYFQLRAHRGLNTPEMGLYAAHLKADFAKINPVYGSINAGTDPARLVVDALEAMRTVAKTGTPFDIPANDELSGIPTYKNFAGMLITAALALRLGARPILKPLFCYSPFAMLGGQMENNFVDYNVAKVFALRAILDAPIWAGEPIGFLTHEEDRCQSATTTALHAALAASLKVEAFTFASTDEAYSRGPIVIASRIDTFQSVRTALRFLGSAKMYPTSQSEKYSEFLQEEMLNVLRRVRDRGSFVRGLYEGLFGTREEGGNPGQAGRNTVKKVGV
jgi:methylmalonyl-CoA mutase cobalamin-binding subunit